MGRSKIRTVKAASLLLDESLYPRHKLISTNVDHLRQALRAGEELPPVVADEATLTVVDGWHRTTGVLREFGKDAEIKVEFRNYTSKAEMLFDAIVLNSGHGAKLSSYDEVRCITLAEEYRLDGGQLARALRMTPEEVAQRRITRTASTAGGKIVALKMGVSKQFAGKRLSKKQAEGVKSYGGLNQVFYVNQVIALFESDLLDTENANLMDRLAHLRGLLDTAFGTKPRAG